MSAASRMAYLCRSSGFMDILPGVGRARSSEACPVSRDALLPRHERDGWATILLDAKHHTDQSQDSQDGDQERHYRRQGIGYVNVLRSKLVHGCRVLDRGQQYHYQPEADHDQPKLPSTQQATGPRNLLSLAKLLKELVEAKAERYQSNSRSHPRQ